MIPISDKKQIINEFVTEIMQKLKVPDDKWRIDYTQSLNHPTSYVRWKKSNDINETIKYCYQKKLIQNEIFKIPKSIKTPQGVRILDTNDAGLMNDWEGVDITQWIMYYLLEMENIDFWMSFNNYRDESYLINKIIDYNGVYYVLVLNTDSPYNMWCNLYKWGQSEWFIKYFEEYFEEIKTSALQGLPISIVPFGKDISLKGKIINWDILPWGDLK